MNNVAEHSIPGITRPRIAARHRPVTQDVRCMDTRWPAIAAALASLRAERRCSVRIIDADCGEGALLLCAARRARALGFTAIEARGIDHAAARVSRARAAAASLHDPAIGIEFEAVELVDALDREFDFPADIIIWHGSTGSDAAIAHSVQSAGRILIADPESIVRAGPPA